MHEPGHSLDGITMTVVATAATGVVGDGTLLRFSQEGNVVSARYRGGHIVLGYLVGLMAADGLHFRYVQIDSGGRLDGGRSRCEVNKTEDGRLRVTEHFQWESREGSGTNVFEEIPGDSAME